MSKTNEKTVLEHLLDSNKKMILASRYQNTIYQGKTLCEYFGVESKTKKEGNSLSELIDEIIYEIPVFDYEHFLKHMDIYKKYPRLCLRVRVSLYPINRLIKHFEKYKDKEWVPIMTRGIRWYSGHCKLTYINVNTLKIKEEVLGSNNPDVKTIQKLRETKRDEYLMKAKWSDYVELMAELDETYIQEEETRELAILEKLEKELDAVRFDGLRGNDDGTE